MGEQQAQADKGGPFAGLIAWVRRVTAWALALRPVRAWFIYLEHHGPMLADSITYRTLFSVFAGVFLGFAIGGIWLSGQSRGDGRHRRRRSVPPFPASSARTGSSTPTT